MVELVMARLYSLPTANKCSKTATASSLLRARPTAQVKGEHGTFTQAGSLGARCGPRRAETMLLREGEREKSGGAGI